MFCMKYSEWMKKILFVTLFFSYQMLLADVMNLNEFMPTKLEDASPIDEKTFAFQYSSAFEDQGNDDKHIHRPNIRYGLSKQLQLDAMASMYSGTDENESGDIDLGGLYQINQSSNWVPTFAINPLVTLPTGKKSQGNDIQYKFLISSTICGRPDNPKTQIHFNFNHSYNDKRRKQERLHQFLYAIGVSFKISPHTALVADVLKEDELIGKVSDIVEMGLQQSLGLGYQIGVGLGTALSEDTPSWTGALGLEKQI